MKSIHVEPLEKPFNITIDNIASDKSISHRCAMFSLLSDKTSTIKNYLTAEDTLNTLSIVQQLGATVVREGSSVTITPPKELTEPKDILDCGNSGTAMRLFCGFLSSLEGSFVLNGDKYLNQRPMNRVTKPLKSIGALIDGREEGNKAPLFIRGASLESFVYESPVDSAQVKSAMILAALRAKDVSKYKENELTRDHTERMLKGMGATLATNSDGFIEITPLKKPLRPLEITVPTDPSSAFFFAVAAAVVPGSQVTIKNVTLNPTRIEAYKVLQRMGTDVEFIETQNVYEPIGDIIIKHNKLEAVIVQENISWLIDELPALAIAMSQAQGTSKVMNAKELRVKESDRIKSVVTNLDLCGISYNEFEDGYEVIGSQLKRAKIDSCGDHRVAMSFAIGGLLSGMDINDTDCILTSFPNFENILESLKNINN